MAAGRMVAAKTHPTFIDIEPPNQTTPGVRRRFSHNEGIPLDVYYRRLVAPFFTRERVDAMRHKIQETANTIIEQMINEGCEKTVDLAEQFSRLFPSLVCYCLQSSHLIY